MGRERAKGFIEQAARAGIRQIVFSGGEPFVHFATLRALLRHAGNRGIRTVLFTNGSWASSPDLALHLLSELKQTGLNALNLSTGRYHLLQVPLHRLTKLLLIARKLGIRAGVKIVRLPRDPIAEGLYRSLQPLASTILVQEISPLGRASSLRSAVHLRTVQSLGRPGCLSPPVLLPSGHLLTCCNLPARDMDKDAYPFVLGNLEQNPLKDLLKNRSADPLLDVLRFQGPVPLLTLLADPVRDGKPAMPPLYHNSCDLCFQLFREPERRAAIRSWVQRFSSHEIGFS